MDPAKRAGDYFDAEIHEPSEDSKLGTVYVMTIEVHVQAERRGH